MKFNEGEVKNKLDEKNEQILKLIYSNAILIDDNVRLMLENSRLNERIKALEGREKTIFKN